MDYNRREIKLPEYLGRIYTELHKGVLITTQGDGKPNAMTISWGALGIDWARPVFTTYVRHSRYTHELLERGGEFTVNIPRGAIRKDIFAMAGRQSGRNVDKVAELGLTLVDAEVIDTPAVLECPITLECKVIYKQLLDSELPEDIVERFYPADVTDIDAGGNCYRHVMYVGEIVAAYEIEE